MKKNPTTIKVQRRDLEVLSGLFESRLMTSAHITQIYFAGKREAAKKRLQKLKAANLISERDRRAREQSVLFLARKGAFLLQEQGKLSTYRHPLAPFQKGTIKSDLMLRHELEVMDVKVAFYAASQKSTGLNVRQFITRPPLYQFEVHTRGFGSSRTTVRPDGFMRFQKQEPIGNSTDHFFFLELDRSTEPLNVLVERTRCYSEYYKSGGFALWNMADRAEYRSYPFRVLMIFKTKERRNNIAKCLLESRPPILTQACLSTLEEVTTDPFGSIWICPSDYREAFQGNKFNQGQRNMRGGYRRHSERERILEATIRKFPILWN